MNDKDPESTPFFKVAMVSMGVFAVVALSPVTDTLLERHFQQQEWKKEEARPEHPICEMYRKDGYAPPEWADCRKLRKL